MNSESDDHHVRIIPLMDANGLNIACNSKLHFWFEIAYDLKFH